jgi:hypothetical protein
VTGRGGSFTFHRDGQQVGTMKDSTFPNGRVVLGIFQEEPPDKDPFSVSFATIEVRAFAT